MEESQPSLSPNLGLFPIVLGFFCAMFLSIGGLVTVMRASIDMEVKLEMSRDIFILLTVFCIATLVLTLMAKLRCTANAKKSYKVC